MVPSGSADMVLTRASGYEQEDFVMVTTGLTGVADVDVNLDSAAAHSRSTRNDVPVGVNETR
jgi:hypothetical protein